MISNLNKRSVEGVQTNNGNDLNLPKDLHFSLAHPKNQILGDPL